MAAAEPSTKRPSSATSSPPHKKRNTVDNGAIVPEPDEAITSDEIRGTETPTVPRNAFSELMAPIKPKPTPKPKESTNTTATTTAFTGRAGLGAYIANPTAFPASRVIFHTPTAVAIHDMFPKATVHCLLLPRSPAHTQRHPFDAFDDAAFLTQVRAETARLKELVAAELRRRLGAHSRADAARNAVLDGEVEPEVDDDDGGNPVLPAGRDWMREVLVGVHSVPSMSNLHVHVLSRDMHSDKMKHRKHYLSFTSEFFVPLEDFPLAADDPRRHQGRWPERPMLCFRCGRNFGNKFRDLKDHLEEEYEEWKKQ